MRWGRLVGSIALGSLLAVSAGIGGGSHRGSALANPCAANPCEAKAAAAGTDQPLKQGPYKDYKRWTRMNDSPVYSATHGATFVVTYVNPKGLPSARKGTFPFPVGTVIVKEAFASQGCKPGAPGAVFVMEKREKGYDPKANDWHWVRYNPGGALWGQGKSGSLVDFCPACHVQAKVNDYVFGNGTTMKAQPTPLKMTPCQP